MRHSGCLILIIPCIKDGLYQPSLKARMAERECERIAIGARLAEAPRDVPDAHPGIAEIHKRKIAARTETRLEASSDIRSLVGKIVLHPGEKRGEVHAILYGSLIGILDFANDNPRPDATRVITSVSPGSPE